MQSIKLVRINPKIWLILSAMVMVVGATVAVLWAVNTSAPTLSEQPQAVVKVPQPSTISSNVLFTGNIYWGRYINDWSMASPLQYAYPFSRLSEFNRESYDAWVSGLECPLVAGLSLTSADEEATLSFNCSPDYLPEAAKWFSIVTLANNHTDNQGADGYAETKQNLEDNNIQYFGNPDPTVIEDVCEVISLPVTVQNDDSSITKGKLPVAMCGYHGVFRIPPTESVAEMEKYSPYMPVIAMPHMGSEYKTASDELKTDFYRSLIDGGADMVLGDHPHWIQNSESYNGHLIIYSMGNFIFDQQDTSEVVRSAAIRVVMKTGTEDQATLGKWLALGESCGVFHDDCLTQIKSQNLTKLDISYQFGVVGSNDGDKIAKPATDAQQSAILQRLNWQTTIQGLQTPYGSL